MSHIKPTLVTKDRIICLPGTTALTDPDSVSDTAAEPNKVLPRPPAAPVFLFGSEPRPERIEEVNLPHTGVVFRGSEEVNLQHTGVVFRGSEEVNLPHTGVVFRGSMALIRLNRGPIFGWLK